MSAFELSPSPDADRLVMGLRAIAVLGLAVVLLNYGILKRLVEGGVELQIRGVSKTYANVRRPGLPPRGSG